MKPRYNGFGLVAAEATPITYDTTDIHGKVTNVNATAKQAVADKETSRAGADKRARALAKKGRTGANTGNGEGKEHFCSLCFLLLKSGPGGVVELDFDKSISDGVPPCGIYAKRDGDADFVFLACRAEVRRRWARDTAPARRSSPCRAGSGRVRSEGRSPYLDNPDASGLVATKPELREYEAVYVLSDAEIGLFSDEVVVNCAP